MESRRQTDRQTDRQMSADNIALGFGPPEYFCLQVAGSPYRMASTVHQTWGNFFFPQNRLPPSASAGLGLTPAGTFNPFPPLYKAFPECRLPPSASAGLGLTPARSLYRKFSRRVGCLPARPLASALRRLAPL
ncbi:unnamed protein product [Rangifer tarandus platyrhynchus]|uniref:Uncharacterized protein n=1 Tax=Rangifer tarandus platyrhynchus TaxID=3082113 RepID=A0ACB1MK04_RANTA